MTWLTLVTNRWIQLAAGTALGLVFGFGLGHHQKTLEDAAGQLRAAKAALSTTHLQSQVTEKTNQSVAKSLANTQLTTTSNLQRIPIYVTRKADDQCIVSAGAVQLLDAAAGDTVPRATVSLPDANSGVALSSLVSDSVVNAGNYYQLAERLKAWDDWYDEQAALTK